MVAAASNAFFIVGPTAVGKTELAVRTAELCGAEIVNADAFQVYVGLEQLTAKPSPDQLARVPHHLVGHTPLTDAYNVARYREDAVECLREIASRGKQAIVVGGSGLYVKALTHGLSTLPPAQPEMRAELEGEELPALVTRLGDLDPEAAQTVDTQNKRRVIRALEVCLTTGRPFSAFQNLWAAEREPIRGVLLQRPREDLLRRITERVEAYLDEAALDQTRAASIAGFSDTSARIIGLSESRAYLAGELSRADFIAGVTTATRQYAKRQLTWFRREPFRESRLLDAETDLESVAHFLAQRVTA